jgi:hypothetical protein
MGVERSEIGLHESLRQRGKAFAGAIPCELVGRVRNRGAEFLLKAAAHQRVQPVGGNDQVISPEFVERLDRGVIPRRDACCAHALLQDGQQLEPADRGEADAVDLDALAMQIERDVLPALHPGRDGVDGFRVVGAQKFQRLFGEHHAEPPGRAFGVLLEQVDVCVRVTPLPEIGEVEASGASADDGDTHVFLPIDSILINLCRRLICAGNLRYRKMKRERDWDPVPTGGLWPVSPAGSVRERLSAVRQLRLGRAFGNAGLAAAAHLHAIHPHGPADHGRLADDDRAARSGAAGPNDAAGTNHRVGLGRRPSCFLIADPL